MSSGIYYYWGNVCSKSVCLFVCLFVGWYITCLSSLKVLNILPLFLMCILKFYNSSHLLQVIISWDPEKHSIVMILQLPLPQPHVIIEYLVRLCCFFFLVQDFPIVIRWIKSNYIPMLALHSLGHPMTLNLSCLHSLPRTSASMSHLLASRQNYDNWTTFSWILGLCKGLIPAYTHLLL